MLGSFGASIAFGILSNLAYDAIFPNDEILNDKVNDAYDKAKSRFYKKYGDQFGNELSSFLEQQRNIDIVVKSLFYSQKNITHYDIDVHSFDGHRDGTKTAVIDFISFLYDEMHKDNYLDRILTEKTFMANTNDDLAEIKKGISKSNKGIEGLKNFFTSALNKSMDNFRDKIPFDITFTNESLNMASNELPEVIFNGLDRRETVNTILRKIENKMWYHVKGEVGSGKTQLLLLLANRFMGKKIWINLKDISSTQMIPTINASLALQTKIRTNNFNDSWYERAISNLNEGDVIIIDDIPNLIHHEVIGDLLLKLARRCQSKGVMLLTSSSHDLGSKVKQHLGNGMVKSEMIPFFNDNEIEELLLLKGAPNDKVYNLSKWIGAVSKNNPSIVNVIADYLSVENWNVSLDVFEKVTQGYYIEGLITEIQTILIDNIKNNDAKQLLYRLTLINEQFSDQYVQEVARVEPNIEHPFEKITELLGYWVTKIDQNYTINPLVSKIGELNLDNEVFCEVHKKIAKLIAKRNVLNPFEIIKLITHLISAREYNQAAYAFINVLQEINNQEIEEDLWGITLIWKGTPLPKEIDYDLQVMIRTSQLVVLTKLGENVNFIIEELEKLILTDNTHTHRDITRNYACFSLATHYLRKNVKKSLHFMKEALTTYDHELFKLSSVEIIPEEMIWLPVHSINNHQEIDKWIDMVKSLNNVQIEKALQSELFYECCLAIVNRVWFLEHNKDQENRDWDLVFVQFRRLEELAEEKNIQLIKVCIVRAKIVVYGEYFNKLGQAETLAENFLKEDNDSGVRIFLIKSMIGKQFLLKKKYEKATSLLKDAISVECNSFPLEQVDALVELSQCLGFYGNNKKASKLLANALDILEDQNNGYYLQKVKCLGEYAISLWIEGKINEAYFVLQDAADLLFQNDIRSRLSKCQFSILGHVAGYYSSMASNGTPPQFVNDGEIYQEPTRGMFQTDNDVLENAFDERKTIHLTTLLYMYAEAIQNYNEAKKWLFKGYELIKSLRVKNQIASVHLSRLPSYLIFDDKLEEAINVSVEASKLVQASMILGNTDKSDLLNDIDVDTAFSLNREKENNAYLQGVQNSIVPIIVNVCNIRINDPKKAELLIERAINLGNKYEENERYNDLWKGIKQIFEFVLNPYENTFELIKRFTNTDESYKSILQGISYIAASMHCTSEEALDLHLKSILWLEQTFGRDKYGTEMILKPFFKNFWLDRYINDRFSFSNTNEIDEKFQDILKGNSLNIKQILQVMNIGFDLQFSKEVFTYLED